MPNWKKVIVSGSDANLRNITASGDISASGELYAGLSPWSGLSSNNQVVTWNSATGELMYTGSYSSGSGGTIAIKEDGVTIVAAATTIDFLNSIVTDGGSGEANVGFDLQGVTDNGAVTTNGSLFFHNQSLAYPYASAQDAKSGFRVDSGKAYTHVTPQSTGNTINLLGIHQTPSGVGPYPYNFITMNKGLVFLGEDGPYSGGGGGTNPDEDHPSDGGGLLVLTGKGIQIQASSSASSIEKDNKARGIYITPSAFYFINTDASASISGGLEPESASAQIRFNTASNSIQFLAGSTNETLKEVLFISRSGDNPRIGIGTNNPLRAFDFKEIRDDNRGGELLIRGSRTTKGAEVADEAGRINFAIDSSSYNNIETSGSTAEIVALVDEIDTSGVKGSLSFRVSTIKGEAPVEKLRITPTQIQATGSFVISGSNSFTNIGPAIFSGSVAITDTLGVDGITTHNNNVVISNGLLDANDSGVKVRGTAGLTIGDNIIPGAGQLRVNDFSMLLGGVHVGGISDPGTDNLLVDGTSTLVGDTIISGSTLNIPNLSAGAVGNYDKLLIVDSTGQARTLAKNSVPFTEVFDGVTPTNQTLVMFSGSTGNTANATGISYNSATGWNFSNVGSAYDITVDDIIVLNDLTVTNGTFTDLTVNGTASISYFETLYETSSIIYSSGSTKFGDTMDDFHDFTGSVDITGSIVASNLSGTNTGDQDLSSYSTIVQLNASSSALQTNIDAKTSITQLNASSSALQTNIDAKASITQLNASSSALQTNIDAKVSNSSTASFAITGSNVTFANITSSGNISASVSMTAGSYFIADRKFASPSQVDSAGIDLGNVGDGNLNLNHITSSGNISSSGTIVASNLSGTNTGDQDLSSYSTIVQLNASSSALQTNIDAKVSNSSTASFAITGSNVTFANITASGDISASGTIVGSNLSGTNTGDQDLSSYSTIVQLNASSSALQSNIDAKASITQLNASSSALQTNIDGKQATLTFGKLSGNALKSEEALTTNDVLLMGASNVKGRTYSEFRGDINVEDGADVTDATNVTAAGALMDSELSEIATVKTLTAAGISGSFTAASASFSTRVTLNDAKLTADTTNVQSSLNNQSLDLGSGEIETNTVSTISTVIGSDAATNVDTFATSTYNGAIYDYILKDSTVGARAGQFMVAHDDGDVTFTDTSTRHLSDSTIPEITADISGADVRVRVTNGNGYTFKSFVKKL
jgi:hypothetical protein